MKVGSLVECVEPFNSSDCITAISHGVVVCIVGKIYTVRAINTDIDAIWVEEIINPKFNFSDWQGEPWFDIDNFRELMPPMENVEEHVNENTLEPVFI